MLLLYGQLIGMGYFVAMGVVEEKSSRVVELLLSTLRPRHLLAGKILGLGVLGFGAAALLAVVGLAAAAAGGALDVNGDVIVAAALALVWFVVGYAFYAAAFACAASLVSRQEDLQSVLEAADDRAAWSASSCRSRVADDPDGTLAKVSSYIPPIAPMTMPPRIALGEATRSRSPGALRGDARRHGAARSRSPPRIYSGAVLRTGGTIKLRDAWKAARGLAGQTRRPCGRRVVAGAGHHELVDLGQVAAHALGHLVEDPARGVDPAGGRRELRLDPADVVHRGERPLDLGPQRATVEPVAVATTTISVRARASEYATSSPSRLPSSGSNTTNSLSPLTSRSCVPWPGSSSSDGTTQTP